MLPNDAPSRHCPSLILVVPGSAVDASSGGGQRSAIFASALRGLGPLKVLVIGEADEARARATFKVCDEIRFAPLGAAAGSARAGSLLSRTVRAFFGILPRYRTDAGVAAAVDAMIGNDAAVVVTRYIWPYCKTGLHWRRRAAVRIMIDVDDRDDTAPLNLGRGAFGRLQRFKVLDKALRAYVRFVIRRMLSSAAHVWLVCAADADGVAATSFSIAPNAPFAEAPLCPPPSGSNEIVLFVGSAAHASNVAGARWFLDTCWPRIRAERTAARFRLVGGGPWRALLAPVGAVDGFDLVGFVDDLTSEYARARVVVSPVFEGGGTKIKVIEACSYNRPIVATRHSIRGFGAELETAIPIADNADAFISQTLGLLADPPQADRVAAKLKAIQARHFAREALEKQLRDDVTRVADLRTDLR